jgi:murein DD-endopeptidase MepM/ murein hydrolase activator NlpD
LVSATLALTVWLGGTVRLFAQGPIQVRPENITTPTPPAATSLLPTPTPDARVAAGSLQRDEPALPATYAVKADDTVLSVAVEIGIDLDEMHCVVGPDFQWSEPLVVGDRLDIPERGFICHTVEAGETIETIAAQYGVAPDAITRIAWNQLAPGQAGTTRLAAGTHLRIPPPATDASVGGLLEQLLEQPLGSSPLAIAAVGGVAARTPEVAVPSNWPYGSGYFEWPVTGWLSQSYRQDHRALDIASPVGTFVTAADRGVVIRAGWNNQGYGQFVVIDHNIDYVTLYAHLDQIVVKEGQVVGKGEILGTVGSTGNSTGPHLHFEIRDFGRRVNPLELLLAVR